MSITLYFNLRVRISGFNPTTDNAIRGLIVVTLRTASYTAFVAILGAIVSVAVPADSSALLELVSYRLLQLTNSP